MRTNPTLIALLLWTGSGQALAEPSALVRECCHRAEIAAAPVDPALPFDPELATRAYLATIPAQEKARSDAYFEGQQWLRLWQFLLGAALSLVLLVTGLSAWMRDLAERLTSWKPLQTAAYWAQYLIFTTLVSFPFAVYRGFIREHQYGLANQTFGSWLSDQTKGFAVGLILGGIFVTVLYGVVRRLRRSWWIWGALVSWLFLIFTLLISPVFIQPIFNKYTRLTDEPIRSSILRLARANGIKASEIYQFNASKQSKRISANVSGFLGTERIALNDNLLKRASLPEIEAVMGHEMGHYVLNQIYLALPFFGIVLLTGFAALRWGFDRSQTRWGSKWRVREIGDVAGLPLASLIATTYLFLLTPLLNTYTRTLEAEADLFGLNAARQPDGMAKVTLKLAEYRKLEPGPLEEWIFYDHPSGRARIFAAMRWKAENLALCPETSSKGSAATATPQ